MWEIAKWILGIIGTVYSIFTLAYMAEEVWDWSDLEDGFTLFLLVTGALVIWWSTAYVSIWLGIIYLVFVIIGTIEIIECGDYFSFHFVYSLVVVILLVCTIVGNVSEKNAIAWDMENYETQVIEIPVMGISGDQIIVKTVNEENESFLRPISLKNVKWRAEDTLMPYLYLEKYVYTKYDYREDPPKVVERGREKLSDYILCGTEKQIRELLGNEVSFNFEQ